MIPAAAEHIRKADDLLERYRKGTRCVIINQAFDNMLTDAMQHVKLAMAVDNYHSDLFAVCRGCGEVSEKVTIYECPACNTAYCLKCADTSQGPVLCPSCVKNYNPETTYDPIEENFMSDLDAGVIDRYGKALKEYDAG